MVPTLGPKAKQFFIHSLFFLPEVGFPALHGSLVIASDLFFLSGCACLSASYNMGWCGDSGESLMTKIKIRCTYIRMLILRLKCLPQGSLEKVRMSASWKTPGSKKFSLKSVAVVVDHQVTIGVAYCPLSNTGAVLDDHCVVQWHTSNMATTEKQGDHWRSMVSSKWLGSFSEKEFLFNKKCTDVLTEIKVYLSSVKFTFMHINLLLR